MKSIFFTIVIPTRDRLDTLRHTISCALAQEYENFEILVSDNASEDGTQEYVLSLDDPRVRYVNTGRRLSMSENWEFALNHVAQGWVTILGDDDGILPGALSHVNEIVRKTGTMAIRSNGCLYLWPSLIGEPYGALAVGLGKGFRSIKSLDALQRVMDGKLPYNELPMLYNGGFINVELISEAKRITGKMFLSMSPDVYSGIVFSLLTDSYIYVDEPLAINGTSHHSGGTARFEEQIRQRSYDPSEKFHTEKNLPFHPSLPMGKDGLPVRSIQIVVYEAFLQAEQFSEARKISVSKQKQLEIAVRKSRRNPEEIVEWAEKFAEMHGLNVPKRKVVSTYSRPNFLRKIMRLDRTDIRWLTGTIAIHGSVHVPLSNVAEASIVAGAIKALRPNRLNSIFRRLISAWKDEFQL